MAPEQVRPTYLPCHSWQYLAPPATACSAHEARISRHIHPKASSRIINTTASISFFICILDDPKDA
jgi:hypothetical protein